MVACRRYCCVSCDAILTVVPRGVAPRRHYGHAAIAMALTLWAIAREPVTEVRRRVCAWSTTFEAATRWPALERWARAARGALGDASLSLIAAAARAGKRGQHGRQDRRCHCREEDPQEHTVYPVALTPLQ